MSELRSLLDALNAREYERAVLVTLVKLEGTGYRKAGAQMIVADDGWSCGAVSGGCIEGIVREQAMRAIASGVEATIEVDTTSDTDVLFGSGLGCPGRLWFRFEPFTREECPAPPSESSISLHTFGAGNDAMPLCSFAAILGWPVNIYDAREAFLTPERFSAHLVLTHPAALTLDAQSAAVVTTHNYFLDLDWLRHLLRTDAGYIAIVGSRKRFEMLCDVLTEEGFDVSRLRGPAGLDIGSERPAEIALSVIAEAKAVLAGRKGGALGVRRPKQSATARP